MDRRSFILNRLGNMVYECLGSKRKSADAENQSNRHKMLEELRQTRRHLWKRGNSGRFGRRRCIRTRKKRVMFQQSANFADLEQKYQQLYTKLQVTQALEDEVSKVSKKLELSEEVLQKALSSSSVLTFFEQEMSELRGSMNSLQNKEQTLARKMQNVNKNFQNISDTWKQSLNEINSEIANLKSESKNMHNNIKLEINTVEQGMKELKEKMEELEVSTLGNTRAIKEQEEEDLGGLDKQASWNTKSIEGLADQQRNLISKDMEFMEKLTEFEAKFKECEKALPIIDNGVHSVLKVSRDLITTEKKMDDMTVQMFNLEDNMLKVITEILDMKKELEVLQSDSAS
ncbi:inhibitor of nuclear factor kappa-B kinase-interacting protein-like isoform X3 [Mobula birostris]|uniref:inhibitor of nuclear factor kappa-B kinase-interacting protein-like isoform X3 n=1 Tax=Mobula birostris TaxID=1983395 RepID=UPI003B27D710